MSSAKSFLISSSNCAVKVFKICLRFSRRFSLSRRNYVLQQSTNSNLTQNEGNQRIARRPKVNTLTIWQGKHAQRLPQLPRTASRSPSLSIIVRYLTSQNFQFLISLSVSISVSVICVQSFQINRQTIYDCLQGRRVEGSRVEQAPKVSCILKQV